MIDTLRWRQKEIYNWIKTSIWAFPLVLLIILLLLTALKISGSSVGMYHKILYGSESHDPDLLYGKPQAVRSDEWLATTQMLDSQTKTGLHKINPDLGTGRNLVLQSEIPNKDWSTLFKPQNWVFLILPLEFAFAFKWWLLMFLLMVSCYFFALRVLEKKLLSILVSIVVGLSPFALWWYQSSIFMGLAYGFFMILLGMRILNRERMGRITNVYFSDALHVGILAFVAACFGLILYPPFQIPIAIVVVAFLGGYFLHKKVNEKVKFRNLLRPLILLVGSAIIAGVVGVIFILSNRQAIDSLTGTVYPGARTIHSGTLQIYHVFDSFLMPLLQSDQRGMHFFINQSEASNFILLLPFLLAPGFAILWYEYKKERRIDWIFLAVQACGLIFLIRAFIPFGDPLFHLLLLQKVPNERLVIGMGFVGVIQLIYILRKVSIIKIPRAQLRPSVLLYSLSCFLVLLWVGSFVRRDYPLFVHSWALIGGLALVFTSIITALLLKRPLLALCLLLLFTLGSSFRIIPLYRSLGFVTNSAVVKAIDDVSAPKDTWATVDNIYFENIGILAGRDSLTGVQIYPDLSLWRKIGGAQYDNIYNREGHALFTADSGLTGPLRLVQPNYFQIKLACSPFVKKQVDFFIATKPLASYPCLKQVRTVNYPQLTFYLYKVTR